MGGSGGKIDAVRGQQGVRFHFTELIKKFTGQGHSQAATITNEGSNLPD